MRSTSSSGRRRWSAHIEIRTMALAIWSQRIGGAVFYDVGDAAPSFADLDLHNDVGLGARWLIPQLNSTVIRIDWAVPLQDGPRHARWASAGSPPASNRCFDGGLFPPGQFVARRQPSTRATVRHARMARRWQRRARRPRGRDQGDADADLREDIRFLGRLLGDTVREQAGAEVFDLVESIRRTAIRYRKDHDAPSLKHLERTIGRLGAGARDQRRARVQLLPSPGERRRGSARAARAARRGNDRAGPRAAARRARADAEDRRVLRARAGRAGADRAPDRGAAQEHPRSPPRA